MPNHIYQRLQVFAPDVTALSDFMLAVQGESDADGSTQVTALDVNRFFPMPAALRDVAAPTNIVSEHEYLDFLSKKNPKKLMGCGGPITQVMADEYIQLYGAVNWYDWANNNWGTKWGIYSCSSEWEINKKQAIVYFQSAWGPANKIIEKLSTLYPAFKFKLGAVDEGGGFHYRFDIVNGNSTLNECTSKSSIYRLKQAVNFN